MKNRRFVSFSILTYPEDADYKVHIAKAKYDGYPFAYIIHDKDSKKDGSPDKIHCHTLMRVPNAMTVSAFASRFSLDERLVEGVSSYKSYAVYLVHGDYDSALAGKYQYSPELVQGSLAAEIRQIIKHKREIKQASSKEDESNIIVILDYLDSCEYLSVSDLCRWCALNGLYSVFRRGGNIILRALSEHNKVHYHDSPEYFLSKQVEILKQLSDNLLRRVSGLYGDMWERQKNPFEHDKFKEAYDKLSKEVKGKVEYIDNLQGEAERKRLKEHLSDFENPLKIS